MRNRDGEVGFLLRDNPMIEFSENAWYYTFSTIAQTLAGAIALLAAFVLYRLNALDVEMTYNGHILAEGLGTEEARRQARTLNGERRFPELIDLVARSNNAGRPTEFLRLNALFPFQRRLMCWFVLSISLTAITILASVILIPFAPNHQKTDCIERSQCFAWVTWLLVILGFVGSIASYAKLICMSLKHVRHSSGLPNSNPQPQNQHPE